MSSKQISKVGAGLVLGLFLLSTVALAQYNAFGRLVEQGKNIGVFDFFVPFVLAFAIFYGLLTKVGVFGTETSATARTINVVVALAAAGFVIAYTPIGFTFSQFFASFFANSLIAILAAILVIIGATMFFGGTTPLTGNSLLLVIIILAVVLGILVQSGGLDLPLPQLISFGLSTDMWLFGAAVVLIALLALWAWRSGGSSTSASTTTPPR